MHIAYAYKQYLRILWKNARIFTTQDSDDSDNGYGNETVIELDDSDEDFVDMLVNLADDKDTESPNQKSSASGNENLFNEGN